MLVVLGTVDDLHVEQHARVVDAAELGALALVLTLDGRGDLELVDHARDDVHLHHEVDGPEVVDHITRGEAELHRLVHRQVQGGGLVGRAHLVRGLLVGRVGVLGVLVVERPAPLEAHHVDHVLWLLGDGDQLRLVAGDEVEEHRNDDDRDRGVERLDGHVVPGLRGDLHTGAAAPVEDHAPDDQTPHQYADHQRRDPGALPHVEDHRPFLGDRTREAKPGEVVGRAAGGGRDDEAQCQRLRQLPPHRAPRRAVGAVGTHVAPSRSLARLRVAPGRLSLPGDPTTGTV